MEGAKALKVALLAIAVLWIAAAAGAEEKAAPTVAIDSGPIVGKWDGDVRAFLGIPFAAPPVGDSRWRPPAAVKAWTSPRDCTAYGPVCPQPRMGRYSRGLGTKASEDCLYLNVWAPPDPGKEKLPVMVWIHGGGMVIGAGSLPIYNGAAFARKDVILVTINYRLGPFGFFGHPWLSKESEDGVSGNYGILDQIAALTWVKRNAKAFGGDPCRITIFGESAGAVSVCTLMVTPASRGLFHRAIAQSGTAMGVTLPLRSPNPTDDTLEARGVALAKRLGATDLSSLRAVATSELLKTADPSPVTPDKHRKYGPVIDGRLLFDRPAALFAAGRQHHVPLMIGANADDGSVFTAANRIRTVAAYRLAARLFFGADAKRVLAAFPAQTNEDVPKAVRDAMTVSAFVAPSRRVARNMEKVKTKAWLYHFRRVSFPAKKFGHGADHGFEIPYVFGSAGRIYGANETDRKLSRIMQDQWVSFAATGDPNGEGLPKWLPCEKKTDLHQDFGDVVKMRTGLLRERCDLFDEIVAKRGRPAVSLPASRTRGSAMNLAAPVVRITMDAFGKTWFEDAPVDRTDLLARLTAFADRKRNLESPMQPSLGAAILRIDHRTTWGDVRRLIALCRHPDVRLNRILLGVAAGWDGRNEGVFAIYQPEERGLERTHLGRSFPPRTVGARIELRAMKGHRWHLGRALEGLPAVWKSRPVWLSAAARLRHTEVLDALVEIHRSGATGVVFPQGTLGGSGEDALVNGKATEPPPEKYIILEAREDMGFDSPPKWSWIRETGDDSLPPLPYEIDK